MTELTTFRHTAIIYNQFTTRLVDCQRISSSFGCIIDHMVIEVNSQRFGTRCLRRIKCQTGTIIHIAKHFNSRNREFLCLSKCISEIGKAHWCRVLALIDFSFPFCVLRRIDLIALDRTWNRRPTIERICIAIRRQIVRAVRRNIVTVPIVRLKRITRHVLPCHRKLRIHTVAIISRIHRIGRFQCRRSTSRSDIHICIQFTDIG